MSKRMKALKSFRHPRQGRLNPGAIFPVKDKEILQLSVVGLAEEYHGESEEGGKPVAALNTQDVAERAKPYTPPVAAKEPDQASAPAQASDEKPIEKLTVAELKARAAELGLKNYGQLKKAELLSKIKGRYNRRDMRAG
jgi:hypothetical protein